MMKIVFQISKEMQSFNKQWQNNVFPIQKKIDLDIYISPHTKINSMRPKKLKVKNFNYKRSKEDICE